MPLQNVAKTASLFTVDDKVGNQVYRAYKWGLNTWLPKVLTFPSTVQCGEDVNANYLLLESK